MKKKLCRNQFAKFQYIDDDIKSFLELFVVEKDKNFFERKIKNFMKLNNKYTNKISVSHEKFAFHLRIKKNAVIF